jgi:hypothetical protein
MARSTSYLPRQTRGDKGGGRRPAQPDWAHINPYVSWALGPGRNHFFRRGQVEAGVDQLPLLLRLKPETADEFLDGAFLPSRIQRSDWQKALHVLSRPAPGVRGGGSVWIAALADEPVHQAIAGPGRGYLQSVSLGRPLDARGYAGIATAVEAASRLRRRRRPQLARSPSPPPPTVVMGVIDDGIAFAHERFRTQTGGTRVEYCWLQDWGSVLSKTDIDGFIGASHGDEDLLYRTAGLTDYRVEGHKSAAWTAAHGTHVMDLACGEEPAANRDDRPIVCVQLPVAVTADENPGDLAFWIAHGIDFIVAQAQAIATARGTGPLPVVVNISYGLLADPHDGTSALEAYIEDKIAQCQAAGFALRVVLPSGNSYLPRTHARLRFTRAGQQVMLPWRTLPDDRTPSFLEIWLPPPRPTQSRLTLEVTSPTGATMTIAELGAQVSLGTPGGDYAWAYWTAWPPSNRAWFTVVLQSSAQPDPQSPVAQLAPAGTWRVQLTHTGGLAASDMVHAWVRRDDQAYGFPLRGRQSFFDDPRYRRFDHAGRDLELDLGPSPVRREGTINSMATGASTIVIGAMLGKERLPAKYSSAGALVLPPRDPDAMTVAEDSRVHTGVLAAASRSGARIAMGGTSVAAPQVARRVADLLASAQPGDRAGVQALATIPLPQPERSGAGGIPANPIVRVKRFEWP